MDPRTRTRRRVKVAAGALAGMMALTGCDWTTITGSGQGGWLAAPGAGNTADIVVGTPRGPSTSSFDDEPARNGAIRFTVAEGAAQDPEWINTDHAGTPLSHIGAVSYLVAVRQAAVDPDVLPYLVLDVTYDVEGTTVHDQLVLDADEAIFDPALPDLVPMAIEADAVPEAGSGGWMRIAAAGTQAPPFGFAQYAWYTGQDAGQLISLQEFLDLHPDATIAASDGATPRGIRLTLGNVVDEPGNAAGFDGYVDGLWIDLVTEEPVELVTDEIVEELAWDFEPVDHVTVVAGNSRTPWDVGGGTVHFVDGPVGDGEVMLDEAQTDEQSVSGSVQLEVGPGGEPSWIGTNSLAGTPLAELGTLYHRSFERWTESGGCQAPKLVLGVDTDADGFADVFAVHDPCVQGEPAIRAAAADAPADPGPGTWRGHETLNGFWTAYDAATGDVLGEGFWTDEIAQSEVGTVAPFADGTAALTLLAGSVDGDPLWADAIVNVDALTWGLVDAPTTSTFDFERAVASGGGGGVPGFAITVPSGGGAGSTTLPLGTGSITTTGNADGVTFTLFPATDPMGTPANFDVIGQSWTITPPEGFDFDTAEVCLPYDAAALVAAGYDEADVALVHYGRDGVLEDITTSVDTDADVVCGVTDSFSPFAIGILDVDRLAGSDRAATAAAISAATFDPGAPVAYIATGASYADALAGGPAAAETDGPVLLTDRTGIPAATATELARLAPARIVVLGGTAAVSDDVLDDLRDLTDGAVTRLAGGDRFSTAAAVSAATFDAGGDVVYVATGDQFADALTGGAAAARDGAPVLLVSPTAVPGSVSAELARLAPARIVVLGGTAAVSDAVVDRLEDVAPVTRVSGTDRYGTAAAVAATFTSPSASLFVATGTDFPDALTGVPAAGRAGAPILLVAGSLPATTEAQVNRLDPGSMRVLGGTAAVADEIVERLRDAMLN